MSRFGLPALTAILAAVVALVAVAGTVVAILALNMANNGVDELKQSRRNALLLTCKEGNDRHAQAKVFVDELVAKGPKRNLTPAQARVQREQVGLFLEAIAPKYDCAERLAKLSQP